MEIRQRREGKNLNLTCLVCSAQKLALERCQMSDSKSVRRAILECGKYKSKWMGGLPFILFIVAVKLSVHDITCSDFPVSTIASKLITLITLISFGAAWHYLYLPLIRQKIDCKFFGIGKTEFSYKFRSIALNSC